MDTGDLAESTVAYSMRWWAERGGAAAQPRDSVPP